MGVEVISTGYVKSERTRSAEIKCALQPIDVQIQPIIQKMYDLGFVTYFSCASYSYPGHRNNHYGRKANTFPYIKFDGNLESVRELSEFVMFGWEVRVDGHYFTLIYEHRKGKKESWDTLSRCLEKFRANRRSGIAYIRR